MFALQISEVVALSCHIYIHVSMPLQDGRILQIHSLSPFSIFIAQSRRLRVFNMAAIVNTVCTVSKAYCRNASVFLFYLGVINLFLEPFDTSASPSSSRDLENAFLYIVASTAAGSAPSSSGLGQSISGDWRNLYICAGCPFSPSDHSKLQGGCAKRGGGLWEGFGGRGACVRAHH